MSHLSRFRCALRPLAWAAAVTCIATPAGGGAQTAAVLPDVTVRADQDGRLPLAPSAQARGRKAQRKREKWDMAKDDEKFIYFIATKS